MATTANLAAAKSTLIESFQRVRPDMLAGERLLPVHPVLADLLPRRGLQRGWIVGTSGVAAMSLAFVLAAQATIDGAWAAIVGIPLVGLQAATGFGVVLERVFCVAQPPPKRWAEIVIAAAEGADVVIARYDPALVTVSATDLRRIQARFAAKGAVLILAGLSGVQAERMSADLGIGTCGDQRWEGIGDGHGRLLGRHVTLELSGRRMARALRRAVWLPDSNGSLRALTPAELADHRPGAQVTALRSAG